MSSGQAVKEVKLHLQSESSESSQHSMEHGITNTSRSASLAVALIDSRDLLFRSHCVLGNCLATFFGTPATFFPK